MMADLSGQTIRGYELLEAIGEGGFATVYRANQTTVGREVAIKVILPEHANQPEFIRRFEIEARLVARLEHPHIVPLYDYWREPTGAYLVMRWLRGGSMADRLIHGPFSLEETAKVLDQIAAALTVAHRNEVVHRDLKPGNILLDEDGNAYLADFGIAKNIVDDPPSAELTAVTGTFGYISPEQFEDIPATPLSDLYSLGIILYEMLVGKHPFAGSSFSQMVMRQMNDVLPDLHRQLPNLPLGINHVLRRATAKNPAERYEDALSLAADFRVVVSGGGEALQRGKTPTKSELELFDLVLTSASAANPYKGLRAFDEADANDFFGRDALTNRMIQRLGENTPYNRFLAVIGPSGSGKSSVVKAGLIPALRNGALPGSSAWFYAEMSPSHHPLEELENALTRIATSPVTNMGAQLQRDERGLLRVARMILPDPTNEMVLVIDQFEELFTLVNHREEISHFLDLMVAAVTEPKSCVRVIVTLRADFYDRPLMYARFSDLLRERDEVVVPLTPRELERAVVGPAQRVGAQMEPGLAAAIVAEVSAHHGMLPMLQYAMTELFDRREDNVLTLQGYNDIGGTLGALARRADEVYEGLTEDEKKAARLLFLRLVALGEGTEDTRRRASQAELLSAGGEAMQAVIDAFGKSRLLTFDRDPATREPTVEVAHEAIIRQWHRLQEWLDASRADVRLQRLLGNAAGQWIEANQDPSYLLSGARLEQYEAWAAETHLSFSLAEQSFMLASLARRKQQKAAEQAREARERGLEQRVMRRLRLSVALLALTLVIVVILSGVAFVLSQRAIEAQEQAAQCVVTPPSAGN